MIADVLDKFLKSATNKSIHVCGDGMCDEYYEVDAERVSPEFPIPVMMSSKSMPTRAMPGGAANVANQFKYFKNIFDVTYYGYSDEYFDTILEENNIKKETIIFPDCDVPRKKRLYCNGFPLCRWDIENNNIKNAIKTCSINPLISLIHSKKADVIIFSDYDKGAFCDNVLWCASSAFKIVDPKKGPLDKWIGCDLFKPNKKEAFELSGEQDWQKQCDFFQNKLKCSHIVITCGADGVVGKTDDEYFAYTPSSSISAESVIGAGDCFVAFLAMGISVGLSTQESSELAFEAGKIYVQNKYNQPISSLDLFDSMRVKFVDNLSLFQDRDFKLVFTNGVFDVLHAGHIELLKWSKSRGDKLVVALNTDESVRKLNKGPDRPINTLDDRIKVIQALDFVDYVVSFDDDTPIKEITEIKPDLIIKGGDYKKENVVGGNICPVEIFPIYKDLSTTSVLRSSADGA